VLKPNFTGQFPDAVHQVFSLAVDHLSDVVQIRLRLLVLALNLIYLLLFYVELILLTRKVLVQIYSRILFGLNILLQLQLFPSALLKLSFGLK
jgi:hypothetical protein